MAQPIKERILAVIGAGLVRGGALLMLAGAGGILAWQYYTWLRWNYWTPLAVRDAWHWAGLTDRSIGRLGMNKMIDWIFHCPLSFTILAVGAAIVCLGVMCRTSARNLKSA